jgi:AmmeMemoRadiSam system protein A
MARSPLSDATPEHSLSVAGVDQLLDIAERVIVDGLRSVRPTMPVPSELADELRRPAGTFVTLNVRGELNGCIGSIESDEPLGVSVARHAWSAAFTDPRLPALRLVDYDHLDIEISILSPLAPIPSSSRGDLLDMLEPEVHGLLIAAGSRRAVFLPSVWEQLPSPSTFLDHLFHKAGLRADSWPDDLRAFTFTADKFGRRAGVDRRSRSWAIAAATDMRTTPAPTGIVRFAAR